DVLQAEAQRDGLPELLGREVAALDQDLAELLALLTAGDGRGLDRIARREALFDDDIADELARARAPALLRRGVHGGGRGSGGRRRRTHAPDIGRWPECLSREPCTGPWTRRGSPSRRRRA